MPPSLPGPHFERPVSFDVDASGRFLVLDAGGERLSLVRPGEAPRVFRGSFRAIRCRFAGEAIAVLCADGLLRTLSEDGTPIGEARVRAGAANLAVARSGALLVSYGRRGVAEHGFVLERFGEAPLALPEGPLLEANVLAVESGGFWIAGTGAAVPASRALRLRPAPAGFAIRATVGLQAPPRTAAVGVDNALYVVLEPGESVVRIDGERAEPVRPLPEPVTELARLGKHLVALGPRGFRDLSDLVPRPP
jgi:hypothetical protein